MEGINYNPNTLTRNSYDNITQIHFCPICNNLMTFKEAENNLWWSCSVCDYKEIFNVNKIIITDANQYKPVDYSLYKYDQSLKRCHNKCPICKEIRELCIFYYTNDSMKNGYVCTHCNSFFKNE